MNIEWVEEPFLLDDEAKSRYTKNRQQDMIAVVRTREIFPFLKSLATETECDGPGCIWCETGHDHPPTELAKRARKMLGGDKSKKEKK